MKNKPKISIEYDADGYQVFKDGVEIYSAGNHPFDSQANCESNPLPLSTLRKFAIQTAGEIAAECGGETVNCI